VSDPESVFGSFVALRPDTTLDEDTRAAIVRSIAEAGRRNAALLVTGSFYLCSEAKSFLKEAKEGSGPPQ